MKKFKFNKVSVIILAVAFTLGLGGIIVVRALAPATTTTTPNLGAASTYAILSDTFYNTTSTTIVNGNIGYTTAPGTPASGTNTVVITPTGAITAQNQALSDLNSGGNASCDFTFTGVGATTDLAADTTHVTAGWGSGIGVYYPGKYCTDASGIFTIGTAGINLTGAGTYIFKSDGALNTVAGSHVVLTGASACNVFWTPNGATTLYGPAFSGTVIPVSQAITVEDGVIWNGRALISSSSVTTPGMDAVITAPTCTLPHLTVTKEVFGGGPKDYTTFPLFIDAGPVNTGVATQVSVGAHVVTETTDSNYTQTFSANCPGGNISLASGVPSEVDKTCTITNTYHTPHLTLDKIVVGGSSAESAWTLTATGPTTITGLGAVGATDVVSGVDGVADAWIGTYTLSESGTPANYTASAWSCVTNGGTSVIGSSIMITENDDVVCTITNTYIPPVVSHSSGGGYLRPPVFLPSINIISTPVVIAPIIPKLPKTGFPPQEKGTMLSIVILSGLSLVSIFLYFAQKKQTI